MKALHTITMAGREKPERRWIMQKLGFVGGKNENLCGEAGERETEFHQSALPHSWQCRRSRQQIGVQRYSVRSKVKEATCPAGTGQQVDQPQQTKAKRETVRGVQARQSIHGSRPATRIRIRQNQAEDGAVLAAKVQSARQAGALRECRRPRRPPSDNQIITRNRGECFRRRIDDVSQQACLGRMDGDAELSLKT